MRPRYVKVDRLSQPIRQTDYLQMLGEVMQSIKVHEYNPTLLEPTKELPIHTNPKPKLGE